MEDEVCGTFLAEVLLRVPCVRAASMTVCRLSAICTLPAYPPVRFWNCQTGAPKTIDGILDGSNGKHCISRNASLELWDYEDLTICVAMDLGKRVTMSNNKITLYSTTV